MPPLAVEQRDPFLPSVDLAQEQLFIRVAACPDLLTLYRMLCISALSFVKPTTLSFLGGGASRMRLSQTMPKAIEHIETAIKIDGIEADDDTRTRSASRFPSSAKSVTA